MSRMLQLKDYRLTTAKIYYHLPDHPALLQTYVWQDYDMAPEFPQLRKFLEFWRQQIEGKLHSVQVTSAKLAQAPRVRHAAAYMRLQ